MFTTRNQKALQQYAKANNLMHRLPEVLTTLEAMLPYLGEQSRSRVMVNRIGTLLMQDQVTVIAPSCPDYSHENGKYTFTEVRDGVPLLAQIQCHLLAKLADKIPRARYQIVVADQETKDAVLCRRLSVSEAAFRSRVNRSISAIQAYVTGTSWEVDLMTQRFPDLLFLEQGLKESIRSNPSLANRITCDTITRQEMYQKIGVHDSATMRERTLTTAAQYSALAQIAARDSLLVCNHETVNLVWYNEYQAAVLHNAVSIY